MGSEMTPNWGRKGLWVAVSWDVGVPGSWAGDPMVPWDIGCLDDDGLGWCLFLEPGAEDDSRCRLFLSQTGVSITLAGVC